MCVFGVSYVRKSLKELTECNLWYTGNSPKGTAKLSLCHIFLGTTKFQQAPIRKRNSGFRVQPIPEI